MSTDVLASTEADQKQISDEVTRRVVAEIRGMPAIIKANSPLPPNLTSSSNSNSNSNSKPNKQQPQRSATPPPIPAEPATLSQLAATILNLPAENQKEVLEALSEKETHKRKALEDVTSLRENMLTKLMDMEDKLMRKLFNQKRRERWLSSQAGQLLRALKSEEVRVNKLSAAVHKLSKTKKQLLSRIAEPAWAVPHHYHMTAVEHTSGHTQPHVMDVGSMIRGHLKIFAIANSSTRFQKNATHVLTKAKNQRVKVSEQIKKVYRELRMARAQIKETEKMVEAVRDRLGGKKKRSNMPKPNVMQQQEEDKETAMIEKEIAKIEKENEIAGVAGDGAESDYQSETGDSDSESSPRKRGLNLDPPLLTNDPASPTSPSSPPSPSSPSPVSALTAALSSLSHNPPNPSSSTTTNTSPASSSASSSTSKVALQIVTPAPSSPLSISAGSSPPSAGAVSRSGAPSPTSSSPLSKVISVSPPSGNASPFDFDLLERAPVSARVPPPALKAPGPSSRGASPSSAPPPRDRQQQSPPGYRNIKMRFFQALNLAPPAVIMDPMESSSSSSSSDATRGGNNASGSGNASGSDGANRDSSGQSGGNTAGNSGSNSSSSGGAAAGGASGANNNNNNNNNNGEDSMADWREIAALFAELEPIDKAKQTAWEELEAVLDMREKLRFEIENV